MLHFEILNLQSAVGLYRRKTKI